MQRLSLYESFLYNWWMTRIKIRILEGLCLFVMHLHIEKVQKLEVTRNFVYGRYSIRSAWFLSGRRSKILVCVSLRRKNFIDTFWRPHFSMWRLKKIISVASWRLPKKVNFGPCLAHILNGRFLLQVTGHRSQVTGHCFTNTENIPNTFKS